MRYNNDFWTLEDELGIAHTGDQVARLALEVPAPFTIGVIGQWGAGKTSVLRRSFVTLGGKPLSQAVLLGDNETEEEQVLKDELELLDGQSWSPQAGVKAILEGWSKTASVFECTLEAAENKLLAACEQYRHVK